MSRPIESKPPDELVFYVDEKDDDFADDFTFYVGRDDAVVENLKRAFEERPGEGAGNQFFSFSERILVKNLWLTKDNLKPSDKFWKQLLDSSPDAPYSYLRQRLINDPANSVLFEKLKNESTPEAQEARKPLLTSIRKILNDAIEGPSLANEKWSERKPSDREAALIDALPGPKQTQWRNRVLIEQAFDSLIRATQAGRGLICFSYLGRYLSVTFRKISDEHGYKPSEYSKGQQGKRKEYLFSLAEYCQLIYEEVFKKTGSDQHAHGMVVVTGSTKSGKSEIARGLIDLYLTRKSKAKRRHHLVTFEDPIERFYHDSGVKESYPYVATNPLRGAGGGDYTPRQKAKDAKLLAEALTDALRQTPALFFVGETRNKDEWKVLLDFAATGHLIVTTAHAGSLVESVHKIFEAVSVETPAERSEIASKLLAVIHLRNHELPLEADPKDVAVTNVLFPALWRRTPRAIAALTSDGLASLLPFRPNPGKVGANENGHGNASPRHREEEPDSSVGRRWFIEQLIEQEETNRHLKTVFAEELRDLKRRVYRKATEWDLQGG